MGGRFVGGTKRSLRMARHPHRPREMFDAMQLRIRTTVPRTPNWRSRPHPSLAVPQDHASERPVRREHETLPNTASLTQHRSYVEIHMRSRRRLRPCPGEGLVCGGCQPPGSRFLRRGQCLIMAETTRCTRCRKAGVRRNLRRIACDRCGRGTGAAAAALSDSHRRRSRPPEADFRICGSGRGHGTRLKALPTCTGLDA